MVVEHSQVVVGLFVVVVAHSPQVVVVVVEPDVVVELDVVEPDVVVAAGTLEPQNCTLLIFGELWPLCGIPSLENDPVTWGGEIEYSTEYEPLLTISPYTGVVELNQPPCDDVFDSVTTCSLPAGETKS